MLYIIYVNIYDRFFIPINPFQSSSSLANPSKPHMSAERVRLRKLAGLATQSLQSLI